ncbi:MAG: AI-2E family transporter [Bacteroidota bacterium]
MQSFGSNRPFIKVLGLLAIVVSSFWVASQFPDLVITLIISGLAAFILRPLVMFLEFRVGLRRSIAIGSVFLVVGGLLVLTAINLVPFLIDRAQGLYSSLKNFPFDLKLREAAVNLSAQFPIFDPQSISQKVYGAIAGGTEFFGAFLNGLASFLVNLAIVPFITYFILAEGDIVFKKLIEKVPNKYFEMALNVLNRMQKDLVGYMRGWILDSIIIGLLSVVGYMIIGVDYPFLIGAVAGIANLVPYLGPIVGAVPAFLVTLTQFGDFQMALPIIVLTFTIQMIDNTIVQPLCFSKTVDMHPVTVIFVLIIGNTLMGVAGMIVAIPLATILKATAVETYWGLSRYRITA